MNPETFDGSICRSQEPFPEEKGSVLLQIKDENTPLISSERRLQVQYQAVEEGDGALSESGSTEDVTSPRYGSNGQFALFLYGLFSFGQSFAFVDWNPIENSLLFAFPSWSETTISWQSNIALLSSPLVQWPVWILLKKFKLSTVIKYMCMLPLCLTTSIRVIPLLVLNEPENIFTTLVYISSFTIGVVGVIFYSSLSKFSSLYFRSASTTYPTGIAMICSNIGLVFASIIGPFAVHDPIPIINEKKNIQDEIRNYLLLFAFIIGVIFMLVAFTFPEPIYDEMQDPSPSIKQNIFKILCDKDIVFLLSVNALSTVPIYWSSTFLPIYLQRYGFGQKITGGLMSLSIVLSCFVTVLTTKFVDSRRISSWMMIFTLLFVQFISSLIMSLYLSENVPIGKACIALFFVISNTSALSIGSHIIPYGAKIGQNISKEVLNGSFFQISSLFGSLFLFIFSIDSQRNWVPYSLTLTPCLATLLFFLVKMS